MIRQAFLEIITLVFNDKVVKISTVSITVLLIVFGFLVSPLAALLLYTCYILGYVVSWCLITYQKKASVCLQRLASFYREKLSPQKNLKNSCSICDDLSCKRHLYKTVIPWRHLYIQEDLNNSVEHFYNRIINTFITSWYNELTDDTDFTNELRYCLRYASASAINRFLQLDVAYIIGNKLVPYATKHVDDYLYMQQIGKLKSARFNDIIVEYLGKRLHAAVTNRKNELAYLQNLTDTLLPYILPEKYLKCRNFSVLIREILAGWVFLPLMDVLADPNIINSLVILAITYKPKHTVPQHFKNVEFLHNFGLNVPMKRSSFSIDLNSIKKNTELLYAFMQFLKHEEHVHLLQFCLDVDDFNNKLLTPDLSKKQLEELYSEACTLHKEYLSKPSLNFIVCDENIEKEFSELLKDGVYSIAKLRTSKPLYQAYEHAFSVLENVWLPTFFHSNEFYSYVCGSKVTAVYNKNALTKSALINFGSPTKMRSRKYYETSNQGAVSKISTGIGKIKGALKTNQPIEGALYPSETQPIENGVIDDLIITESGDIVRDLSAWRVSITSHQPGPNKSVKFCINVQRLDTVSTESKCNWVVMRKDQDFYTLKIKLIEFHGETELSDSPLPSRRSVSPVEMRMEKYEEFISKLLQKPALRGSDLLYTFLTTVDDFTYLMVSSAGTSQDLGNIYQSVAHKLRKEKGQHLDSFMSTFLSSTGKCKQSKFEWAELGDEIDKILSIQARNPPLPKTFRNHVFNDNFGVQYKALRETSSTSFHPIGITECLFYLLKHIIKVRHGILKFYAAICSVGQQMVESLCRLIIDRKFKAGLSQTNLAYLIHLLEGVIFDHHSHHSRSDLEERKRRAFSELEGVISPWIGRLFGSESGKGLNKLLEILQHPHYNKQLAYNLLDIVLIEMYPNLEAHNN